MSLFNTSLYSCIRPLLFLMEAEKAHHHSLIALNRLHQLGLLPYVLPSMPLAIKYQPTTCMGLSFKNPVGLAAGLDKNGEYIDALAAMGFGFIEIGTTTPKPQSGNPQPRLFRIPTQRSILNRMGFNNTGVDALIEHVKRSTWVAQGGILGINIGKNASTPIENAADDYLHCLEKVYPYASYIVVNISSPNTQNLRTLQSGDALQALLHALKNKQHALTQQYQCYKPLVLKIAPDLAADALIEIADLLIEYQIDGVIATNTTLEKSALPKRYQSEAGGVSGALLTQYANNIVSNLAALLDEKVPVIGVGGIMQGQDAAQKMHLGASLVQVYSGLIYQGPTLVRACLEHIKTMHSLDNLT